MPQITSAARLPTLATVPVINVENEEKKLSNGVRMIAPAELMGDLMHLKSYEVDDSFLRTGSANWSRSGLTYQDNDVVYIQLPQSVKAFETDFEAMWSRPDNLVLARP
jgi:phosphatidylserine/phosphatidylglycerophosphate/cardiolipin synthase-like enzyme